MCIRDRRQGVELLPTVHEGATVRAMEKKGIRTEKGEFNRWIKMCIRDRIYQVRRYQILSNQIPLPPQGQGWERIGWEPENVIVK